MVIYCQSISSGTETVHSSTKKALTNCYLPVCRLAFSLQNKSETLQKTALLMINWQHKFKRNCISHLSIQKFKVNTNVKCIPKMVQYISIRATENRFFAGSDRFIVCKTDSICIKRIFFGPKKTHFADHILAQFPGLVKCQTVNCPQLFQLSMLSTHYWIVKNEISQ